MKEWERIRNKRIRDERISNVIIIDERMGKDKE